MKIEFIPLDDHARDTPPEPIKRHLPNWYKQMPNTVYNLPFNAKNMDETGIDTLLTAKRCVPFSDFLTSGYLFRFHTDILIDPTNPQSGINSFFWKYRGGSEAVGTHPHQQLPIAINGINYDYIKFMNPWIVKTPVGYSCLFMRPLDLGNKNFVLLPAIVDTDTYDEPINFPGYVVAGSEFKISCGSPLMTVFPFKRDEWSMNISKNNFDTSKSKFKIKNMQFFENAYRNFFHAKKKYD